jgi:rhodanese-related sulfurtransferase
MSEPPDAQDRHDHSPAFQALVDEARPRVREITIEDYRARLAAGETLLLIDIREDHEWDAGRIPGALHIGRGILERDVEKSFPDKRAPLVLQCGGGYRSVLSADNLRRMGYTSVASLAEGIRGWIARGLPLDGA